MIVSPSALLAAILAHPAALIARIGDQASGRVPVHGAGPNLQPFPFPRSSSRKGEPQCFGPIQYRPRKTRGVFVRMAPPVR